MLSFAGFVCLQCHWLLTWTRRNQKDKAQPGRRPYFDRSVGWRTPDQSHAIRSSTQRPRRTAKARGEASLARPAVHHARTQARSANKHFSPCSALLLRGKNTCLLPAHPRSGTTAESSHRRDMIIAPDRLRNHRFRVGYPAGWNVEDQRSKCVMRSHPGRPHQKNRSNRSPNEM
jgi:hypothetical protein